MIRNPFQLSTKFGFLVDKLFSAGPASFPACAKPCFLCGNKTRELSLCAPCQQDLPWNSRHCLRCALPLDIDSIECGACLSRPPPFAAVFAPLRYEFPVNHAIEETKYRGSRAWAKCLARILTNELIASLDDFDYLPDVIVPVPADPKRNKSRPMNHINHITRILSKTLDIPSDIHLVRKLKSTPAQTHLKRKDRIKNLNHAFSIDPHTYTHIALFDDVVTTGATAEVLAKALLQRGATRVDVWALARTPEKHK